MKGRCSDSEVVRALQTLGQISYTLIKVLLNTYQITPATHLAYRQRCEGVANVQGLHIKDGTSVYMHPDVTITLLLLSALTSSQYKGEVPGGQEPQAREHLYLGAQPLIHSPFTSRNKPEAPSAHHPGEANVNVRYRAQSYHPCPWEQPCTFFL